MRPTVPALLMLAAMTAQASARDFNGFYAGVNAGYIAERGDREGSPSAGSPAGSPGAFEPEPGLPPSALSAADRMTGQDARGRSRAAPRR